MAKRHLLSAAFLLTTLAPGCDEASSDEDVCELAAEVTAECYGEDYFPVESCDPEQAEALLEADCEQTAAGKADGVWPARSEYILLLANSRRSVWFETSVSLSYQRNDDISHQNAACWLTDGTVVQVPVQSWGSGMSVTVPSNLWNRIRRNGCRLDFIWNDWGGIGGVDVNATMNR